MSLPAMSFGDRFCMSRNGGTARGHGGCTHHGQVWGSVVERQLVGTGWPISVPFGMNELRNKPSNLKEPLFLVFRAHFSATPGL